MTPGQSSIAAMLPRDDCWTSRASGVSSERDRQPFEINHPLLADLRQPAKRGFSSWPEGVKK